MLLCSPPMLKDLDGVANISGIEFDSANATFVQIVCSNRVDIMGILEPAATFVGVLLPLLFGVIPDDTYSTPRRCECIGNIDSDNRRVM